MELTRDQAHWIDAETIAWRIDAWDQNVHRLLASTAGGLSTTGDPASLASGVLRLKLLQGGLTDAQRARFPHLWNLTAFTVDPQDAHLVPEMLRGEVLMTAADPEGHVYRTAHVQIPGVLDDVYGAAATVELGPTFDDGVPTLRVWAPTAQQVALELFGADLGDVPQSVEEMARDEQTGVWSATGDWSGRYYRYRVTVWQPATGQVATSSVTDPYSVSLAPDSTHSQVVDLTDPALAPEGWADTPRLPKVARPHIHEVSVRDFSIADSTVPEAHRGTYLAFTHPDSAGMRHLASLAAAGLSHVHLLPVFDFATVPERREDRLEPDGDLAALPPDSPEQQHRIGLIGDRDGYNWGYDPYHYSAPEGSYATDPAGAPRIVEFRRMVDALHRAGLRVVMDVVFNHTMASGVEQFSVLDRIVPGYYHRLMPDGEVADSTCCANTAPEHLMMGKLVVDSVLSWARHYGVDGFRFDLMGHHPKANILAVRDALGDPSILVYGEGWNFGEVANDARFVQATQHNMAGTGIGTFSDRMRDAIRGGGAFDTNPRVQGFASGLYTDPNGDGVNGSPDEQRARLLHYQDLIQVGLSGNLAGYSFIDSRGHEVTGWQVDYNGSPGGYAAIPADTVTYVDAHDNEILYDALAFKLPTGTSAADRARMQVVALAATLFGQGAGFVTIGSDRLRSKSLDRNSFNSGDWFNQIRWDCADGNGFGLGLPYLADNADKWDYARPLLADRSLVPDCAAIDLAAGRYAELLRIRQDSPVFALQSAEEVGRRLSFPLSGPGATPGVITMWLDGHDLDERWASVVVIFNATPSSATQAVPGLAGADVSPHPLHATSVDPQAREVGFDPASGTFTVAARTVAVFVQS